MANQNKIHIPSNSNIRSDPSKSPNSMQSSDLTSLGADVQSLLQTTYELPVGMPNSTFGSKVGHSSIADDLNRSDSPPAGASTGDITYVGDPEMYQFHAIGGGEVDRNGLPINNILDEVNQPQLTHNGYDTQDRDVDQQDYGGLLSNTQNDVGDGY